MPETAAEKAEREKKMASKGFWRKTWEIFQTAGAGAGLLAFQNVISGVFSSAGKKAGEKLEKKLGEVLGLDPEAAEKTTDDESLFEKAIFDSQLSPTEKKAVWGYLRKLRETNPRLAKEWVRWIHNTLVKFAVPVTINSGPTDKKEIRKSTDYTEGIKIVDSLLREIAVALDDSERLALLAQRNICCAEKKVSPTVEGAKKFAKETAGKGFETAKTVAEKTVETAKTVSEKISKDQKANFADLGKFAETANNNAKRRLQDAINKKRR